VNSTGHGKEGMGDVPACVPDYLNPTFALDIVRHFDVTSAGFENIHEQLQRVVLCFAGEGRCVVDPDCKAFRVELLYFANTQNLGASPYLRTRISHTEQTR
jgi:hypothetical protein